MALTTLQKTDLKYAIEHYMVALDLGDNDLIADTSEFLDTTVCAMHLEELDGDLLALIEPTYADECDTDEALAILRRALEQLV